MSNAQPTYSSSPFAEHDAADGRDRADHGLLEFPRRPPARKITVASAAVDLSSRAVTNGTNLATLDDTDLAIRLAREAGRRLLALREQGLTGAALKNAGDQLSQRFLSKALRLSRSGDAVLSEEAPDDSTRLSKDRVWIIDPLDGTREYSEPGRADWAVHVALWEGGELVAGAVAVPAVDVVHSTADAPAPRPAPHDRLRLAVSRSRPPEFVTWLAEELDAELVAMGSAGVKAMSVVIGESDAYVHAGGQYEWDSAAPVAVAQAAGLHASRLDGSPLIYNQVNPWLPDLVICRTDVLESLSHGLRQLG